MHNYNKSVLSPYDPTKLAIHSILRPEDDFISNCGPNVKTTVSFDDVVHFIDEENMVTYVDFDCGITIFPETPTKIRLINRERNFNSRSCKNSTAFPATINIPVVLMGSIALISFWTRTFYWTWFQQLLCHSTTLMIHTLSSISNQYPQPTTQQPRTDSYPVFSSLRTMNSKRKGLRVSLAFFQKNYLQDGRVNKTVATVEELSDLWKPGPLDGVPPFVMNCNCT